MNRFKFCVHINVLNLHLSQFLLACSVPTIDTIPFCFDLNTQPACIEIEANYGCGYIMYFYSC